MSGVMGDQGYSLSSSTTKDNVRSILMFRCFPRNDSFELVFTRYFTGGTENSYLGSVVPLDAESLYGQDPL